MLRILWAIARNTFTETIRQPAYVVLLAAGMVLIAFSPLIAMFTMMEDVQLVVDMGLATIFLAGLVLSALSASQVISVEIRAKTAATVMSKPVGRFTFVLGKYFGVLAAQFLAIYLLGLILVFTKRMGVPEYAGFKPDFPVLIAQLLPMAIVIAYGLYANYFHRAVFASTATLLAVPLYTAAFVFLCLVSKEWRLEFFAVTFRGLAVDQLAVAVLLLFFGVAVMASVAVAASTRLQTVANISLCSAVFLLGMVSDYVLGRMAPRSMVAKLFYWATPNFQAFWVSDQLIQPNAYIPLAYVREMGIYAAALIGALLCLGSFLFEERELV
ncbi:MAG TPA: hypothetical protein PL033_20730 [Candidatus Brocadiia bacterium]|nr:hypothetical protein [Candidatus Brocadiia bacterium]